MIAPLDLPTPPEVTPATAAPSKDLRYTIAVIASVAGVGWMVEFPESFVHTPFLVAGAADALMLLFGGMPDIIFTPIVTHEAGKEVLHVVHLLNRGWMWSMTRALFPSGSTNNRGCGCRSGPHEAYLL